MAAVDASGLDPWPPPSSFSSTSFPFLFEPLFEDPCLISYRDQHSIPSGSTENAWIALNPRCEFSIRFRFVTSDCFGVRELRFNGFD